MNEFANNAVIGQTPLVPPTVLDPDAGFSGDSSQLDLSALEQLSGSTALDQTRFSTEIDVLSELFGEAAVVSATGQVFREQLAEASIDFVKSLDLPPSVENETIIDIRTKLSEQSVEIDDDVRDGVEKVLGDDIKAFIEEYSSGLNQGYSEPTETGAQEPPAAESRNGGDNIVSEREQELLEVDEGNFDDTLESIVDMVLKNIEGELLDEMKRAFNGPGGYSRSTGQGGGPANTPGTGETGATGTSGAEGTAASDSAGGTESTDSGGNTEGAESVDAGGETSGTEPAAAEEGATGAEETGEPGGAEEVGASEETGGTGGGGTSADATGNWLTILASVLGQASGKHLKAMVELGSKMGQIDSEAEPEMFAQFNAEFQAESQIFKMFQEAISTMIKSIGEGMSSVARKS